MGESKTRQQAAILVVVLAVTALVYSPVAGHRFINLDDPVYVLDNPQVTAGLTPATMRWALTSFHADNWHPLTWWSHQLDVSLYGVSPRAHHLHNLALHLLAGLCLWLVLSRAFLLGWASVALSALWLLHPLQVQSVAWVSERKDMLCALWWMLTLLAYHWYVQRPSVRRYLLVLLGCMLALLAKPMAVTLPLVLLVLDWWPLSRYQGADDSQRFPGRRAGRLLLEKLPLFGLSAAVAVVTVLAQGQAIMGTSQLPIVVRLGNAVVSVVAYGAKLLWPSRLSIFYPYQVHPWWLVLLATLVVMGGTVGIFLVRWRAPVITVGWLWYVITLAPVLGIVQVGAQPMADRYTYLPSVGVLLMLAGLVGLARERLPGMAQAPAFVSLLVTGVLCCLVVLSAQQVRLYRDSITLYQHAIAVFPNNYVAHKSLGNAYAEQGQYSAAAQQFSTALAIKPDYGRARLQLARVLIRMGNHDQARAHLTLVLRDYPEHADALALKATLDRQEGNGAQSRGAH